MSGGGLLCPGCGSSNVVEDDLYSQPQMVCVDCGSVVSEGSLVSLPMEGTAVSYSKTTAETRKPCKNLILSLQRVSAICQILRLNRDIEDQSRTYYKQAYQHPHFIHVSLHKKHVLAGCCVLVCCREHNWPMSMGTIGYLVDATPAEVGGIYQEMTRILNIVPPIISATDQLEAHCHEYKIAPAHVSEELAEKHIDLFKRAEALVELAAKSWILTGRRPTPIMMAAVYLAWQSLKPSKLRLNFSLAKFCLLAKVQQDKLALKRIAELKEVLCKLGKELPWLREEVTSLNVVPLVSDILQHRTVLLGKAMRKQEEAQLAQTVANAPAEESDLVDATPTTFTVEQSRNDTERTELQYNENDNSSPSALKCKGTEEDPNWGKRVLFAPPCVIHPKKRRVQPERKDVIEDEEISDSEIESYIRTPQEVREFALSQKILFDASKS